MASLVFHPEAEKEFTNAMLWYDKQREGLGKKFEISVEVALSKIQSSPETFGYSKRPYREASLVLFPYTIVFKLDKRKQMIYVVSIYHTSRNPKLKYRK